MDTTTSEIDLVGNTSALTELILKGLFFVPPKIRLEIIEEYFEFNMRQFERISNYVTKGQKDGEQNGE